MVEKRKTVSLVLGSGGARGLSHIGVIKWLESEGYEIKSISGSSIGALIGGVYAAGKIEKLEEWMSSITRKDIVSLLDISWGKGGGMFKGEKVIKTMVDLLGDTRIEDLSMSFTAVSTDIKNGKEVWINSGSLFDAIRASISMPLFFTPVEYHGTTLIDGAVLNPVPIAPTFNDETDLTIAVNLGGERIVSVETVKKMKKKIRYGGDDNSSFSLNKIFNKIKKLTEREESSIGMYDVADKAIDVMQAAIARQKIAAYPPDVVVEIPVNACGTLEFDRAREMIDLGYKSIDDIFKN